MARQCWRKSSRPAVFSMMRHPMVSPLIKKCLTLERGDRSKRPVPPNRGPLKTYSICRSRTCVRCSVTFRTAMFAKHCTVRIPQVLEYLLSALPFRRRIFVRSRLAAPPLVRLGEVAEAQESILAMAQHVTPITMLSPARQAAAEAVHA